MTDSHSDFNIMCDRNNPNIFIYGNKLSQVVNVYFKKDLLCQKLPRKTYWAGEGVALCAHSMCTPAKQTREINLINILVT